MSKPTKQERPATLKEKAMGLFWGAAIAGVGIWMIAKPESPLHLDGTHRGKVTFIASVLEWIWGIPGGIVLILLGLLVIAGGFTSRSVDD